MTVHKILFIISVLFVFLISGCSYESYDQWPHLVVEDNNPPKFRISGHGTLDIIYVSGPALERKTPEGGSPYSKHYWGIMPKDKYDISLFEKSEPITYGQVPEGFIQVYPERGEALPLFEGGNFVVQLDTKEAR